MREFLGEPRIVIRDPAIELQVLKIPVSVVPSFPFSMRFHLIDVDNLPRSFKVTLEGGS